MAELKAQTSAAGYAMGQNGNALKSYYGALLENPNVQRGLATLKATEGTLQKPDPYASGFGKTTLSSFTDHPGISYGFTEKTGKKNRTTAAGAYQFLSGTWKGLKNKLGLPDFSPLSQDIAALGLIDEAGGLKSLIAGDIKGFVSAVGGKWASLPSSTVSQMHRSWGFVEDAWNNALNPNKDQLPGTAPTPYSRDAPQSFADARPDNQDYAGPKGIFSVDTSRASPIGHVARSPLGPATPSGAKFSGMGTPRGMGSISSSPSLGPAAPSVSKSAPSRPDTLGGVHMSSPVGMGGPGGNYVDAASAAQATAATHAAASAARQAAAQAPAASTAPSPSRPDTLGGLSYSSPKGIFSVDPGAKVQASIAPAIGPTAPAAAIGTPVAPARPPSAVPVAPVAAAAVPKPAVAVAPATPSFSRQAIAPAQPALSAKDVYGGTIGTAQTSTPGTTVSRAASFGPTYTSNKFGAVTATAPDGTQMAAWGGVPASKPAIAGPLGQQIGPDPTAPTGGMFGPKAKAATGVVTGAALGGFALGPLGAALGGLIGKNMAQGKAPLSGILGGKSATNPGMQTVDTYAGKMSFSNPVGGLGFPSAPAAPKGSYTGPKGGSGGLSSQARDALGKNNGLY